MLFCPSKYSLQLSAMANRIQLPIYIKGDNTNKTILNFNLQNAILIIKYGATYTTWNKTGKMQAFSILYWNILNIVKIDSFISNKLSFSKLYKNISIALLFIRKGISHCMLSEPVIVTVNFDKNSNITKVNATTIMYSVSPSSQNPSVKKMIKQVLNVEITKYTCEIVCEQIIYNSKFLAWKVIIVVVNYNISAIITIIFKDRWATSTSNGNDLCPCEWTTRQ